MNAIEVRGLSKRFILTGDSEKGRGLFGKLSGREFWALKNVSFTVKRGDRLGVMGHNGAGKSVLLKILSKVILPTTGEAFIRGRSTSLLEVGTGFNPNLTGIQNIYLNAALHGLSKEEIDNRMETIISFSEIGKFVHEPIKIYSSGMRSRLGFAVAAHLDPDILMLDEVLSVGDAAFQRKSLARMEEMTGEGRTLLFVSHSTAAVKKFCNRCVWLAEGEVVMEGDALTVCEEYESQMMSVNNVFQAKAAPPPPTALPGSPKTTKNSKGEQSASSLSSKDEGVLAVAADEGEACRLISAMVVDLTGNPVRSVRIDTPCAIEMVFDVIRPGLRIEPALHVMNERGEMMFVVAYTDPMYPDAMNQVGRYRCEVRIPSNLLNEGLHFVTIALSTADPLVRHEVTRNAVSFSVYEVIGDPTKVARGRYARNFPGGLRPRLEWVSRVDVDR
ncbi:MAG: ATP-binding cassette domain-containing protein [Opitutaceae bacterium]|nr:ATP-binding cassette domain-containing protein [Opitutaceae bacterium]